MRFETKLLATALGAATLWVSPAAAQATRTWVSGLGDDVNPCSRTAPCKTFAGAISKTAAGGEIDCLDPAGFGTLTITKSITIDCTGTFGSVLNSGGINGFVINDSATATPGTVEVKLRGLSINGAGTTPGLNGIRFISGRSLYVEDVLIQNQKSGSGISFQPTTSARFMLNNVSIVDGGVGILVQPTGTGLAKGVIRNTRVFNSTTNGVRIDSASTSTSGIHVTSENSTFSRNATGISVNSGAAFLTLMVNGSTIANNTGTGISSAGFSSSVMVGDTTITGNATGVSGPGFLSFGDNRLDGNPDFAAPNNGVFGSTILKK
jgi:hypothetical protein